MLALCVGLCFEDAGSRNNGIGTRFNDLIGIVWRHTAINFDPWICSLCLTHFSKPLDLLDLVWDELLSTESGIDGHDQNQIRQRDHVLDQTERRRWIENNPSFASQVLDLHMLDK